MIVTRKGGSTGGAPPLSRIAWSAVLYAAMQSPGGATGNGEDGGNPLQPETGIVMFSREAVKPGPGQPEARRGCRPKEQSGDNALRTHQRKVPLECTLEAWFGAVGAGADSGGDVLQEWFEAPEVFGQKLPAPQPAHSPGAQGGTMEPTEPAGVEPDRVRGSGAVDPQAWFGIELEAEPRAVQPESAPGSRVSGGQPNPGEPVAELTGVHPDWTAGAVKDSITRPPAPQQASPREAASVETPGGKFSGKKPVPTESVSDVPSDSAGKELQPTSAWRERSEPESWFRDGPPDEVSPETDRDEGEPPTQDEYPRVFGYSSLNLEYDTTIGEGFDDTLVNIRTDLVQEFSPTLFMSSDIRVVFDGEDDGLRTYNTDLPFQGVYIRKLKLQKETDDYALFGGKFEPGYEIFGYAPIFFGNYSTDFNLEERAGIGGALFLDKENDSELRLTAQAFYLDKSRLSGELFSGRARDGITEGQVGDTGRLDNYLVSVNGGVTGWEPGLRYSIGIGQQRPGEDVDETERAVLAAMYHIHRLSNGGDLEFSVDLVRLENAGGFNEDNESVTFGGGYSSWPEYAGLSYSVRNMQDYADGSERTDRAIELVFRKGITESTLIEAAYQYTHAWHEVERNFGIVFKYYSDWNLD